MDTKDIGYWMNRLSVKMRSLLDQGMKEYDLTFSQSRVLFLVCKNNGLITQKEIKDQLGVAHTTVLGIIKRLHKNGFVTVETDKNDKRNTLIMPTEKALSIYNAVSQGAEDNDAEIISGFSQEEIDTFVEFLERLYHNIENVEKQNLSKCKKA